MRFATKRVKTGTGNWRKHNRRDSLRQFTLGARTQTTYARLNRCFPTSYLAAKRDAQTSRPPRAGSPHRGDRGSDPSVADCSTLQFRRIVSVYVNAFVASFRIADKTDRTSTPDAAHFSVSDSIRIIGTARYDCLTLWRSAARRRRVRLHRRVRRALGLFDGLPSSTEVAEALVQCKDVQKNGLHEVQAVNCILL